MRIWILDWLVFCGPSTHSLFFWRLAQACPILLCGSHQNLLQKYFPVPKIKICFTCESEYHVTWRLLTCNDCWTFKISSLSSSQVWSGVFRPIEEQWELPDILFGRLVNRWSIKGTFLPLRRIIIVKLFLEISNKRTNWIDFSTVSIEFYSDF